MQSISRSKALVAAMIGAVLIFLPCLALAQAKESAPERILFDSANQERTAQGLSPLKWDAALAGAARQHALRMAQQNALSHQFPGESDLVTRTRVAGAHFSAVAENVAQGPNAANIHTQWMKSPPHRANLLDPDLNSLGVAVAEQNGQLFAVEDFSQALTDLSIEEQESQVRAQMKARGLRVLSDTGDARQTCKTNAMPAGNKPIFMTRYSTTELDKLPEPLAQKIQSGRYHSAAVGACSPAGQDGFGEYQVAVLLYE